MAAYTSKTSKFKVISSFLELLKLIHLLETPVRQQEEQKKCSTWNSFNSTCHRHVPEKQQYRVSALTFFVTKRWEKPFNNIHTCGRTRGLWQGGDGAAQSWGNESEIRCRVQLGCTDDHPLFRRSARLCCFSWTVDKRENYSKLREEVVLEHEACLGVWGLFGVFFSF